MQPPVWGASGHCLREVNIEEEEEGEGSQKLFDAFDCFLNFSFCLNPCLVFKLTSRRAEKDQWPQHLGLRPALKAFRSSPHTTWAPGDKTADCRLLVGMCNALYRHLFQITLSTTVALCLLT